MTLPLPGGQNYSPRLASRTFTFTASAAVTAGDPVQVSGEMTVARVSVLAAPYVGIAATNAKAGDPVTVHMAGPVHTGLAQGAIAAGDPLLAASAAGAQVRTAPGAADPPQQIDEQIGRAIIGLALSSAPAGGRLSWLSVH
jgi:hypothetical protein